MRAGDAASLDPAAVAREARTVADQILRPAMQRAGGSLVEPGERAAAARREAWELVVASTENTYSNVALRGAVQERLRSTLRAMLGSLDTTAGAEKLGGWMDDVVRAAKESKQSRLADLVCRDPAEPFAHRNVPAAALSLSEIKSAPGSTRASRFRRSARCTRRSPRRCRVGSTVICARFSAAGNSALRAARADGDAARRDAWRVVAESIESVSDPTLRVAVARELEFWFAETIASAEGGAAAVDRELAARWVADAVSTVRGERRVRLLDEIRCWCEKEEWTRSLSGCFENCANPQKNLIDQWLTAGLSNDEIRKKMVQAERGHRSCCRVRATRWTSSCRMRCSSPPPCSEFGRCWRFVVAGMGEGAGGGKRFCR